MYTWRCPPDNLGVFFLFCFFTHLRAFCFLFICVLCAVLLPVITLTSCSFSRYYVQIMTGLKYLLYFESLSSLLRFWLIYKNTNLTPVQLLLLLMTPFSVFPIHPLCSECGADRFSLLCAAGIFNCCWRSGYSRADVRWNAFPVWFE